MTFKNQKTRVTKIIQQQLNNSRDGCEEATEEMSQKGKKTQRNEKRTENQEINKLNWEAQYPTMNLECARRKGKEKERRYVSKL